MTVDNTLPMNDLQDIEDLVDEYNTKRLKRLPVIISPKEKTDLNCHDNGDDNSLSLQSFIPG